MTGIIYLFAVLIYKTLSLKQDLNMFTERRLAKGMSGVNHINTIPGVLDVNRVKALSKARNVTINDVVLTAFMKSMHDVMADNEAKKPAEKRNSLPKQLTIAIPANIRFELYETREKIVCENKFASSSTQLPVIDSMDFARMKKATDAMKAGSYEIYATYFGAVLGGMFAPFAVSNFIANDTSQKMSACVSNIPAAIKPFEATNSETGEKIHLTLYSAYANVLGKIGFLLIANSHNNKFTFTLNTDDNVADRATNQRLLRQTYENILKEVEAHEENDKKKN